MWNEIISIGDHCAIPIILNEIGLRKHSYPFDWVVHKEQLNQTCLFHNMHAIRLLINNSPAESVAQSYLGDALMKEDKINTSNDIFFPHEKDDYETTFSKYCRRFNRLKESFRSSNIYVMLTRHYYIDQEAMAEILNIIPEHSRILFISGYEHSYLLQCPFPRLLYFHIPYDKTLFYSYDYTNFRPAIKLKLQQLFYSLQIAQ